MSYADDVIRDAVASMPAEAIRKVLLDNLNPDALRAVLLAAVTLKLTGELPKGPTVAKASSKPAKEPRASGKAKPATARAKGEKRSPDELANMQNHVREILASQPGLTAEGLAVATGWATKDLAIPIRKLLNAKQIRTEGQKRGTRYYPAEASATTAEEPKRKRHPRIHAIPSDPAPVQMEQVEGEPERSVETDDAIEHAAE